MSLPVITKKAPVLVAPAEPTPSGHLPLSFFDRLPALNFFVETIFVFRHGVEPAKVVREAIAKALVPYYPVAGRITSDTDDDGQLQVACTGEGLWFVEASASCTLEDVGYVERQPLVIPKEQLIPSPPPEVDQTSLSFMVQVTEFTCGGFTIGFKSSHVMFGGLGAAQFKKAIGDMARGLARPTITPVWRREAIPRPPERPQKINQPTNSPPFPSIPDLEHFTTDLSPESVDRLKRRVEKETGQRCTVFDVVAAVLWQCRTRAIGLPPEAVVTLHYPAMVIQELHCMELPPDAGYYGNCSFPVIIEAPGGRIAVAPIWDIVGLIKSSKDGLSSRVSKWLKGDPDEDPDRLKFDYALTNLVDMRRSGLSEVDCGWGAPDHVVPLMDGPVNLCIALNSPAPEKGVRLMTHCVEKEHLEAFGNELKKLA